ncbi:MAG: PorT family protein [Bacteroidales bacterium]|nr:PorT family protein [Bacteroidales bacterium]
MKALFGLFVLVVCVSFSQFSNCQTVSKISFGAQGGAGVSSFQGLLEPGLGYNGGFTFSYKFADRFSVQSGINYDHKQTWDEILLVNDDMEPLYNANIKHIFEFVSVPVLANLNFGKKLTYFVNAGPYFAFLLKQKMLVNDEMQNTSSVTTNTDSYNRFEIGFSLGAGLAIPINDNSNLSFSLRNNLGLNSLSKPAGSTFKTNSTLLLVGVNFNL